MSTEALMNFTPNVVVGIGISLLGIALLLDRLGLIDAQDLLRYWPILLILFGASVIAQALWSRSDPSSPGRGQRPFVTPGFVFFIAIVSILFSQGYQRRGEARRDPGAETINLFRVMSHDQHTSHSTRFRGAEMTSIMGRSRLDLREATIVPGEEAIIDVFAMMGQVEILVPSGWTVDVQAVPIMGGVRDRRLLRGELRVEDERGPPERSTTAGCCGRRCRTHAVSRAVAEATQSPRRESGPVSA